jgi:3-methylcrotonyl-CoA carboxylase alpha subunit
MAGDARETIDLTCDSERSSIVVIHHRVGGIGIEALGRPLSPSMHAGAMRIASGEIAVMAAGDTWVFAKEDPFAETDPASVAADKLVAPMPGKIVRVFVQAGEMVKRGQALVALEAMKMEHTLVAPSDAQVADVTVTAGDQVDGGVVVLHFVQAAVL